MWTVVSDCCVNIFHQITRRKSVLYVCERVNANLGSPMATTRDGSSKYRTSSDSQPHQNPAHSFPIQVGLPDGEVAQHDYEPCLRLNEAQEQELTRGYIKPPENRCLCELERMSPPLSYSMEILPNTSREVINFIRTCSSTSSSSYQSTQQRSLGITSSAFHPINCHSSSLDSHHHHHCRSGTTTSSSFPTSISSWSVAGSGGEEATSRFSSFIGSRKHNHSKQNLRNKAVSERTKRRSPCVSPIGPITDSQSTAISGRLLPQPLSPLLACPSTQTALSEIAILPCGTASNSSISFPSSPAEDQRTFSSWDQQPLQLRQNRRIAERPSADEDLPPPYSDVISNPSQNRSISRTTNHRTDNGKI